MRTLRSLDLFEDRKPLQTISHNSPLGLVAAQLLVLAALSVLIARGSYLVVAAIVGIPLAALFLFASPIEWPLGLFVLSFSFTWPLVVLYPLGQLMLLRLDDILYVFILVRCLVDVHRGRWRLHPFIRSMGWMPIIFLAMPLGSLLWVVSRFDVEQAAKSLYFVLKHVQYSSLFPILYVYIRSSKHRRAFAHLVTFGLVVVSVYGLLEFANIVPPNDEVGIYASLAKLNVAGIGSTLARQHTHLAAYITMTLPFVLVARASAKSALARVAYSLILAASLVVGILSLSRLALIGIAICVVGCFLLLRKERRGLVAIILALIVIAIYSPLSDAIAPYIGRLLLWEESLSYTRRLLLWRASKEAATSSLMSLFLGSGFGTFSYSLASRLFERITGFPASGAHNSYLTTLVELGLPGLLALVLFLRSIMVRAWLAMRWVQQGSTKLLISGYLAGLVGLIVMAFGMEVWYPAIGLDSLMGYFFVVTAIVFGQVDAPFDGAD